MGTVVSHDFENLTQRRKLEDGLIAQARESFFGSRNDQDAHNALVFLNAALQKIITPYKSPIHVRTGWGLKYEFHTAGEAAQAFDRPVSNRELRNSNPYGPARERDMAASAIYGIRLRMVSSENQTETHQIVPVKHGGEVQFMIMRRGIDESGVPRGWNVGKDENALYSRDEVISFVSEKLDDHITQQRHPGKVALRGVAAALAGVVLLSAGDALIGDREKPDAAIQGSSPVMPS